MRFQPVEWHPTLPSTSNLLRGRLRATPDLPAGTVIAAQEQTAGRGRQARGWVMVPHKDLAFSFLLRGDHTSATLASLPMAVAVAVAELLAGYGVQAQLKWPNDVRVAGRKIAGILVETIALTDTVPVVVGVGLNVNMNAAEAARVAPPATSIHVQTGTLRPVRGVLDDLLPGLARWVTCWQHEGFEGLRTAWEARVEAVGETIAITQGETTRTGRLQGFGAQGELLLQTAEAEVVPVWSGEATSVRLAHSP